MTSRKMECVCVAVEREYVGIKKCSFSLVTAVVIAQEKLTALILSPASCEILVWSDDDAGNSLKAETMCTLRP